MPASFDNSGKPAYMYDEVGDTWYAFGAKIDTASAYEWTNTQTYLNDVTFDDAVIFKDGFNNFLNPAARDAAITSPVQGTIVFVRQDAGGSPLNQIQFYNGSAWVANDGDINGITAGTGLTGGGTAGTISLAVDSTVLLTSGGQVISANTSANALEIRQVGAGNALVVEDSTNPDASPFTIDSNGLVWVGSTTELPNIPELNMILSTETAAGHSLVVRKSVDGTNSSNLTLARSRGTNSTPTALQNNDGIGGYIFHGFDGTNYLQVASISASVDGTPGTGDMPTRLVFSTTADGGSSTTERMRIDNAGNVFIGTNTTAGQNTGGLTIQGKDIELMQIMGAL